MDIEFAVIGRSDKWVVNQSPVRIGSGAGVDISLPARLYPSVQPLHVELEIVNGMLRVGRRDSSQGTLLLNEEPVEAGAILLSGDILRLGTNGPELRVAFSEQQAQQAPYLPTDMIPSNAPAQHSRDSTQVMNVPTPTTVAPSRQPAPAAAPIPASPHQETRVESVRAENRPRPELKPEPKPEPRPEPIKAVPAPAIKPTPVAPPPVAAPAPAAKGRVDSDELEELAGKLRTMQLLQVASLVVILILGGFVFTLRSELTKTRDDIHALSVQDADAVKQLTPTLDAKLNSFGQRMDGLDDKLKAAETRMENGMDERMKTAEGDFMQKLDAGMKASEQHMVDRMNQELPGLLEKYMSSKLSEIKH